MVYLGDGTGSFGGSGNDFGTGSEATKSLAFGDVDGDGDLDLALGNKLSQSLVILGIGDGTFAGATRDFANSSDETYAVVLGDMDGDGDLDLVVGVDDGQNGVYLNSSLSESTAAVGLAGTASAAPGAEVQLLSIGVTAPSGETLSGVTVTYSDLSSATGLTASDIASLKLYRSTDATLGGDSEIGSQSTVHIGTATTVSPSSTETLPSSETFYIVSAVLSSSAVGEHAFTVGFAAGGFATSGADIGTVVTANDANRVTVAFKSTAQSPTNATVAASRSGTLSATLSAAISAATVTASNFVVHGGFAGQHGTGGTASTHRAATLSGGGTTSLSFDPGVDFAPGEPVQVTLTTGLTDASSNALDSPHVWHFSAAAGSGPAVFSNTSYDVDTATNLTFAVSSGDLDGDGDLDLVTGNLNQVNRVYLGAGNGSFAAGSDVDTPTEGTTSTALGDLDGDGDLDLITGNQAQKNRVYLGAGNGTFATGIDASTSTYYTFDIALGDVDGDGALDMVAGNYKQAKRVYLGRA